MARGRRGCAFSPIVGLLPFKLSVVLLEVEMDFKVNDDALEEALGKVESMRNWSPG